MMLYDAVTVNNIPSLNEIKEKNPDGFTLIEISCPNYQLKTLLELAITKYKDTKYVAGIIANAVADYCEKEQLQHHAASLTFKGKSKIKRDVLIKLKLIAEYYETCDVYPKLSVQLLKKGIDIILGPVDPRTKKNYVNCLKSWLKQSKGQQVIYYSQVDLTGFKKAVMKKIDD